MQNYSAKLSDFGLAKHGPGEGDSHVTTRVMGTYGYAAPEYVSTGKHIHNSQEDTSILLDHVPLRLFRSTFHSGHLYVKSDVYGFGAVLLEVLSGQRAFDPSRPSGQHNFVEYSKPHLADRRKLAQLMDPRLEGQYPSKGARLAAQLTLKCLTVDPKSRPSMKEVVQALEQIELETLKGRPRSVSQSSSNSQN